MAKKDISDIPFLLIGSAVAVEEEVRLLLDRLVEKGKSLTPEGRKIASEAKKGLVLRGDEFSQVVAKTVRRVLENTGIGTRADLEDLKKRVDALEKRVVSGKKPAAKKKATPKKKAARKKPAAKTKAAGKADKPGRAP